jgi:3-phenylpropionate/trans-cinnamate dioxygenase ferredoxin reductase subunit
MAEAGMVIVGAGEAGARAALALREEGWSGPVTLIGEEPHHPYERPPLSKNVMTAGEEPTAALILPPERLVEHDIALMPGVSVTGIDRAARTVLLADGRALAFHRLLLATGARARRLDMADCAGCDAIHYLRSWTDALALRAGLRPGARVVIVGGGFIGLELAASAAERGAAVTLVEALPRILMRGVPDEHAGAIAERHLGAGIDLRVGVGLGAITPTGAGAIVHLADGSALAADTLVIGIGAVPETRLAAAAGLALDNGVKVDERLETSERGIFAAGDCCSFPHPLYGGRRIRLEAWRNAQDQAVHAAKAMLGSPEPYAAIPWFWSDQYDLCLQIAGLTDEGRATVKREGCDGFTLLFHLDGEGRLVAASAFGPIGKIAKEIRLAEMLIEKRLHPDPAMLASPAVKLKALLAA